jgi:GNAT-like C-terminal domain/N-acyltransferase N-terminal domain
VTVEVSLPSPEELPTVLLELAVPHEDINELVARRPGPDLWPLLERYTEVLVQGMGDIDLPPPPPPLPEELGDLRRYFPVYILLAALPHVREYHRRRGIAPRVSWLTLADLGRNMARHRRRHGTGGLDLLSWLVLHFRGALYQLGRLQYQRFRLNEVVGRAVAGAGLPGGPGAPALNIHIPGSSGPLSPEACDGSLRAAAAFFARHFPEERHAVATCHSWLLDRQLAGYLPAESNIVRFQRRFRTVPVPQDHDDSEILRHVFVRVPDRLDELPQHTTLERAVVGHLREGGHWYGVSGWLPL